MADFHILAISGSLRAASLNTEMLRMAQICAPANVHVKLYAGIGNLPLFNPDLEVDEPEAVMNLRAAIGQADAVLFASPEYAHGISGVLKNALDWMVSRSVLVNMPIALWNASPRASHALAALRETLEVMSARVVESASLTLLIGSSVSDSVADNPDPSAMQDALTILSRHRAQSHNL